MPDSHHLFQEKGVQICMDIDGAHFDQAYEFHDTSSFINQSTSLTENLDGIRGSPPNLEPLSDAQEFSGEDVANQFGKVWLPLYKETPVPLNTLLDYNGGVKAKSFRDNIRMYNSMFQFTSIGGKIDNEINRRPGPYVFRLCGQNHHKIGSLLPVDGETPKFSQLYIYDTANELANRMRPFSTSPGATKPDEDVVKQLMKMFDETNIIVRAFRIARDRFGDTDYVPVRLRLIGHRSERQYSDAMSDEVAGLIVGDVDNLINNRDIIVDHKSLGLQRISDLHPAFMAMQYPILFPYGEDGFHLNIKYQSTTRRRQTKRGCVTAREYYAFVIQQRLGQGLSLIKGGKLFHQYVVDAFTSVEGMRLDYVKRNQKKLRSDILQGVFDALARGDRDADTIGKRIILPATFTAGPRYLMQNYQDAMAICRKFGYSDLFITFTCNAKWPEILEGLKMIEGQKAQDRPDIISQVFRIRLKLFMDELIKKKHFGSVVADIIALVTSVSKITKIYVSNNPEQVPKRNIELKNTRGFTLTATLWGNCASCIDDSLIGLKTQPILILTSTTVSEFNGKNTIATSSASKAYLDLDIPMVAEMKAHFQESVEPVAELELHQRPQLSPTEQENINRVNIEQLLAIDHKKSPSTIYSCVAQIKNIDCSQGCYKLLMNAEDDTGRTSFLAFGDVVEKLLGVTVARLTVSGKKDKYVLPEPIQNRLLNQTALFTITPIIKGLEHGHLSFRVIACRIMDQAATSNVNLSLPPPPKTDSQPEKQITADQAPPSSPTMSQIPQDLFPEESPAKKIKTE
ncbi:hypothetical protein PTKIN_Ptkin15bG0058200 [Pterospermum kingtungense]